ncbi:MAG: hypothetical protein KC503_47085 [Myxococcales bacterium]|nr:hypothetical protein [Myxococcales bacterium]
MAGAHTKLNKLDNTETAESAKVMFEVYRVSGHDDRYRVVYYTELNEKNKEREISAAMAGESLFDGFIADAHKKDAKVVIARHLEAWDGRVDPDLDAFERELAPFLA